MRLWQWMYPEPRKLQLETLPRITFVPPGVPISIPPALKLAQVMIWNEDPVPSPASPTMSPCHPLLKAVFPL